MECTVEVVVEVGGDCASYIVYIYFTTTQQEDMVSSDVLKSISRLKPKKVVLSGPSGYLGSRVLTQVLLLYTFNLHCD